MVFRKAELFDVRQMQIVRNSVKENVLSNPAVVPDKDVAYFICERGQGWVCELEGRLIGFSIVDLREHSVWALFVDPLYERQGVGKKLHSLMLDWYFTYTEETLSLGTAPNTRAALFYVYQGWASDGTVKNGEIHFNLPHKKWLSRKLQNE